MSPKANRPILGALYEFEAVSGLKLLLTPCEIPISGQAKGVVCAAYVFRPDVEITELLNGVSSEQLLLPVVEIFVEDFQAGAFKFIQTPSLLKVPLYPRHGFRHPAGTEYYDFDNRPVDVSQGAAGYSCIAPISLCKLIAEVLEVEADCESCWGYDSDYLRKLRRMFERNHPDDYVNKQKLMSIVSLPMPEHASVELLDLLDELEEELGEALESRRLGESTGRCIGAGLIDLDFEIRRGKYPEAVKLIRAALLKAGFEEVTITSSKLD